MNKDIDTGAPQADAGTPSLLQQALEAERRGDGDAAFELLKRSIASPTPNPLAHHLLAAEFMERGEIGNAVLHFTRTLELAPGMDVARLQLALLWLGQGNPAITATTLQPLLDTPPGTALHAFATALSKLSGSDIDGAMASLEAALAADCDNKPLVSDMRTLLDRLRGAKSSATNHDLAEVHHGLAMDAYAGSTDVDS